MEVKLVDRKPTKVVYLRHVGPYGDGISEFWQQTVYPWMVTNGLLGQPRYGISHDDPGITAPEQCRYDACVEIPPDFVASRDTLTTIIPGGRYATCHFEGTVAQVGETWNRMLRDWLPSSGFQIDARPSFEYYPTDSKYDAERETFECDICIPIAPL